MSPARLRARGGRGRLRGLGPFVVKTVVTKPAPRARADGDPLDVIACERVKGALLLLCRLRGLPLSAKGTWQMWSFKLCGSSCLYERFCHLSRQTSPARRHQSLSLLSLLRLKGARRLSCQELPSCLCRQRVCRRLL